MTIYQWIVFYAWIVFIVVWGLSALSAKRTVRHRGIGWRLGFAAVLVVFLEGGFFKNLDTNFGHPTLGPIAPLFGVICVLSGVGLAIWARFYLGRNWGMPMSEKADSELVTSGPYRYIRHPIYSGVLLALFGAALVEGLILLLPVLIGLAYFIYSAKQEEKRMLNLFPEAYADYMEHTSRLIPYVY